MANGQSATLAHFLAVITLRSEEQRRDLWNKIFTKNLTIGQTVREIRRLLSGPEQPAGAAAPKRISINAAIQQIVDDAARLHRRLEPLGQLLLQKLLDMPPGTVPVDLPPKLQDAVAGLKQIQRDATNALEQIQPGVERVQRVLALREAQEEQDKAAAKTAAASITFKDVLLRVQQARRAAQDPPATSTIDHSPPPSAASEAPQQGGKEPSSH